MLIVILSSSTVNVIIFSSSKEILKDSWGAETSSFNIIFFTGLQTPQPSSSSAEQSLSSFSPLFFSLSINWCKRGFREEFLISSLVSYHLSYSSFSTRHPLFWLYVKRNRMRHKEENFPHQASDARREEDFPHDPACLWKLLLITFLSSHHGFCWCHARKKEWKHLKNLKLQMKTCHHIISYNHHHHHFLSSAQLSSPAVSPPDWFVPLTAKSNHHILLISKNLLPTLLILFWKGRNSRVLIKDQEKNRHEREMKRGEE